MKHGSDSEFDGSFDDFDGTKSRPVLITAAEPSYEEQHRARVRKYLTLMAFRIPALILAALAYGAWHNGLISLAIVALSIPLPWMAVLIANDRPARKAKKVVPGTINYERALAPGSHEIVDADTTQDETKRT